MQCSNARSSQRSEPTSAQCKACSDILFCAQSRTSGSILVFLTFKLVRAILLHGAASYEAVFISKLTWQFSRFFIQTFVQRTSTLWQQRKKKYERCQFYFFDLKESLNAELCRFNHRLYREILQTEQSHLMFSKIWGGSEPYLQNYFLNFAKSCG